MNIQKCCRAMGPGSLAGTLAAFLDVHVHIYVFVYIYGAFSIITATPTETGKKLPNHTQPPKGNAKGKSQDSPAS